MRQQLVGHGMRLSRARALLTGTTFTIIAVVSCTQGVANDLSRAGDELNSVGRQDSALAIGAGRIGPTQLCDSLQTVVHHWQAVRDTQIQSEGITWPARLVDLGEENVLFESSWLDHQLIWRVSTDSRRFQSAHGIKIGMLLGDVVTRRIELILRREEGAFVIDVPVDGITISVDESSSRRISSDTTSRSLAALAGDAMITRLAVTGDCRSRR